MNREKVLAKKNYLHIVQWKLLGECHVVDKDSKFDTYPTSRKES